MVLLSTLLCFLILSLLCGIYIKDLFNFNRKVEVSDAVAGNKTYNKRYFDQPPGPLPLPIIGNLALLRRFKVPFQGFTELRKEWGDIYSLALGSKRCVVVNNLDIIREVLNQNGKFFGGRPNFLRYHKLFGGDRNNSLALCDWSPLQQKRRNLARRHCSPRDSSPYFIKMSHVGNFEIQELLNEIQKSNITGIEFDIKPLIQQACANMFLQYMCSLRFGYEDEEFKKIVHNFDEIFWEINQGYAVDFLPWLVPFYKIHFNKMVKWSSSIRTFILERVINTRNKEIDVDEPENDFTDALLKSLFHDTNVSLDTIIYMLEDFIGGHSAVGNLVMMSLSYIAKDVSIGTQIQQEVDQISNNGKRKICLHDMNDMPFTTATIYEVLRYSSSPIVPHVATENVVISDFGISKGTVVFINNYILNTSPNYWNDPEEFKPERFLEIKYASEFQAENIYPKRRNSEGSDSGIEIESVQGSKKYDNIDKAINSRNHILRPQLKKNIPHFLPFSIGKRTCIGQNLVRGFSFILIANLLMYYDVRSRDITRIKTTPACVALPPKTFPLILKKRNSQNITS